MQLRDPRLFREQAFIGGAWLAADNGATVAVTNPATAETLAHVTDMGAAETRRAIEAAQAAWPTWRTLTAKQRGAILRSSFDLMIANADDLATILTTEMGKPLAEAKGEILWRLLHRMVRRRGQAHLWRHHSRPQARQAHSGAEAADRGCASITPWNFPNAMIARKVAPALAAGCGFVARPAAETPLSALALAVLAERAGVPAGLFSVITSKRSSDIGKEFCENPLIRKLTFTGSTEVGRILLKQAPTRS